MSIAETSGLIAIEGFFFENVKIKVTVYCQTFVAMEVFIILERLVLQPDAHDCPSKGSGTAINCTQTWQGVLPIQQNFL